MFGMYVRIVAVVVLVSVAVGCEKKEPEQTEQAPAEESAAKAAGPYELRPDAFLMSTAGPYPDSLLGKRVDVDKGAVDLGDTLGDKCAELVESEEVKVDGEADETIAATQTVQKQLGLEPMTDEAFVRIEYERTRTTRIADSPEYEACVADAGGEASERRITSLVAGNGTLYTFVGDEEDVRAGKVDVENADELVYRDGAAWRTEFEFEDAYFLAKLSK
jgi:hypothetical protein